MAFDPDYPTTWTAEGRQAAVVALAHLKNRVWQLDRRSLGEENTLQLAYAYRSVDETLGELMQEICPPDGS